MCEYKCELGSMTVVSVYCRYGDETGPYLEWMRKVVVACARNAMIIGMDANAVTLPVV